MPLHTALTLIALGIAASGPVAVLQDRGRHRAALALALAVFAAGVLIVVAT